MLLRTLALAVTGAICLATAAFGGDFEISNGTEQNLHDLYLSPVDQNTWGADQLGDGQDDVVEPGGTFKLTGVNDGVYDVKITLDDGSSCITRNVVFEGTMEWTIDADMMKNC